jgi:hypothetical protein
MDKVAIVLASGIGFSAVIGSAMSLEHIGAVIAIGTATLGLLGWCGRMLWKISSDRQSLLSQAKDTEEDVRNINAKLDAFMAQHREDTKLLFAKLSEYHGEISHNSASIARLEGRVNGSCK